MKARLPLALFFLLFFCFCSFTAYAQDTASIAGTVKDTSGANIPNATVVIASPARGINHQIKSNSDGEFLVAGLPPGAYNVSVAAPGFQKYDAADVIVRVAQKARLDVTLQVGNVATQVEVQGEGLAQVETQSSERAGTVTGKEITQLQLNGRNFTQLVTLVPGVSNQTGQDEGQVGVFGNVSFSINGGRTEYNNWELDGGDNMDNGSNTSLNVYPSLEAIDEFKVLTSNYGAQYGRNGSGTVEVETKSGTNKFHGSAYEFLRNDAFNARNFFDDPTTGAPPYKKNDFGYTVGGPIWKDKTYFFWSQEWRRDRVPGQTFHHIVPSAANRAGDFTDQCTGANVTDCPIDPTTGAPYPGNIVPVDPNAAALMAMIPAPNFIDTDGTAYFNGAPSQPTNWREELFRIDHNITPSNRIMFRYIHDSWDTITPTTLWSTGDFPTIQTHFTGPGVSMVARLSSTLSPSLLNEFVASYTTDHIVLNNVGAWQQGTYAGGTLFPNTGGKLPGIQVNTNGAYGSGFGEDPGFIPWKNSNPVYTLRDNVSKLAGKHSFQFGAYLVLAQKNEQVGNDIQGFLTFDSGSAVSTGNGFADLLTGRIASFSQSSAQPKYYNHYKILEPYFQDDWHVTPRLTLNLGLRLSLFGTYREKNLQAYNFEPSLFNPAAIPMIDANGNVDPTTGDPYNGLVQCGKNGTPVSCMKGHLFNPAPRVGFAWDVFGNGKMAVRGGYGVFYEHTNGNEGNTESLEGSAPGVLTPTQYNIVGYNGIGGTGLLPPLGVTAIPSKAIWPYMQQWHLDIQRELPQKIVADISYVGSKGTHLTLQRNINQIHAISASQNPFQPGQSIDSDPNICATRTVNGVDLSNPATNPAAVNLGVACGDNPDPFRPFVGFGNITSLEPAANSSYNALQASARRTAGGFTMSLAYTYSHSLDDSSDRYDANFVDSYNFKNNWASSNFDQRHILNASYVWDLPLFRHTKNLTSNLLGGWQYSGIMTWQTGTPFSVLNGGIGDAAGVANGVGTGSYADLVGNPNNIGANPTNAQGPLLYNPNAYAAPTGLTFGNSGRNSLRNPSRTNFDMSLYKFFRVTETTHFEFRTEAYNVFNHTQWSGVDNTTGDANFLRPSGAHRARTLQFGLKFLF